MNTYKDLIVWQRAMDLVVEIYALTDHFPIEEKFALVAQIRRSAISIPSNIAEGKLRGYKREFKRFLLISYSSGAELETQIEISKRISKTKHLVFTRADNLLSEVMKMLNKIISQIP